MTRTLKSFCRNCGAQCGIELELSGNRIVGLRGDRSNPVSKGYACIKSQAGIERQNGAGRIRASLKRINGEHQPVSTSVALDEIAERLSGIAKRHGRRSVGIYYGTGVYGSTLAISFAKAWAKCLGTPQIYSTQTIDQSPKSIRALRMGAFKSGKQHFATSEVWLLSGGNPVVSHSCGWGAFTMYAPAKDIRAAKRRGLKLIVIDPRLTETARLADIHIQPRPGQDVPVNAALINIILQEGWHDREFCGRYTTNLDVLRRAVAPYTPEYAAAEAEVNPDDLRKAARLFAQSASGSTSSGTGANMSPYANLAEHLLECLNAICGRYRRAGDRVVNPSVLSGRSVTEGVYPPYPIWDQSPKMISHPEVGWALPHEFPTNLMVDEIMHAGEDRLRALIVLGGNPIRAIPDQRAVSRAFRNLDLLVTLDVQMNETARQSDYVVSCKMPYERADISLLADVNSPFPAAQYTDPVVEAPEDCIEEWEVFYELARRMNIELAWEFWNFGSPSSGELMKLDMTRKPTTEMLFDVVCRHPQMPFSWLKESPGGVIPPIPPQYVTAADVNDTAKLDLMPAEARAELESCFASHQGQELQDGQMLLHVRRLLEVLNSNYIDSEAATRRYPTNPLYMNPEDMKSRGLIAGQRVSVRSSHGVLTAIVKPDPTERRGSVSMHHCWPTQLSADATVNVLIDRNSCREARNYVPRMSAIPVMVEREA